MKKLIRYYANVSLFPVLWIIVFIKNFVKMTRQAFRWTVSEMDGAWDENRRACGMDEPLRDPRD